MYDYIFVGILYAYIVVVNKPTSTWMLHENGTAKLNMLDFCEVSQPYSIGTGPAISLSSQKTRAFVLLKSNLSLGGGFGNPLKSLGHL